MRLQSVVHANRRLKEVPYGDHAVSLEEHVCRLWSPPVQLSSCVHGRVCGVQGLGVEVRSSKEAIRGRGFARDHCFPLFRLARFTI